MNLPNDALWNSWYRGKTFSSDWLHSKVTPWFGALSVYKDRPAAILEIGSWEGRSAIAFLEILPQSTITCIDTFRGAAEHQSGNWRTQAMASEDRFDENMSDYAGRFRKYKGYSVDVMNGLIQAGESFDVIYVDGSHRRDDVLADSILAWRLLKIGGTLIWDDLRFKLAAESQDRPMDAIVMFCDAFGSCFDEIHRDRQLIVRKQSEWPDRFRVKKPLNPAKGKKTKPAAKRLISRMCATLRRVFLKPES